MSDFSEFLYKLRKERNMTQSELADKLGVTNKAVSKWETGEAMPETAQLVPLSRLFGVTVDELLSGKRAAESAGSSSEKTDCRASGNGKDKTSSDKNQGFDSESDKKDGLHIKAGKKVIDIDGSGISVNGDKVLGIDDEGIKFAKNNIHFSDDDNDEDEDDDDCFGESSEKENGKGVHVHVGRHGINVNVDKDKSYEFSYHANRLDKISDGICGAVSCLGILCYLLIGLICNMWHPYWIIPVAACISCGLIKIIFDLCNSAKLNRKRAFGENPYTGAICGIIMLLSIISFLVFGAIYNIWHPLWVVFPLSAMLCGAIGSIGGIFVKPHHSYRKCKTSNSSKSDSAGETFSGASEDNEDDKKDDDKKE